MDLKVVPGARQEEFGGVLGSRLKVPVSAPAEDGKANKAVCALIAKTIGLKRGVVRIVSGHASPEKTVQIDGVDAATVASTLGHHCV